MDLIIESKIKSALLKLYPFSEEQLGQFTKRMSLAHLKKKKCLLEPGGVCNHLTFLASGSLRHYTLVDNAEVTINFFTEGQWVTDIDSLLAQKPSKNYMQALEDSEIASISLQDIHRMMDNYPSFRMLNGLIANMVIPVTHLTSISRKSPDVRYRELLSKHPDWITRFRQMHIASYLGMTSETLSRVRARIS
jgi:CRP/FNR family transcriptional regulator, anaerobic regulatory protein